MPTYLVAGYPARGLSRRQDSLHIDTIRRELLEYTGWHPQKTISCEERLRKLGMDFLLADLESFQVPPA